LLREYYILTTYLSLLSSPPPLSQSLSGSSWTNFVGLSEQHIWPLAGGDDAALLADMMHILPHAVGIFGVLLYFFQHYLAGPCTVAGRCCASTVGSACGEDQGGKVHGSCWRCNLTAYRMEASVPREDFLYGSWDNAPCKVPFAVVLDRAKSRIVITIRGTLSLDDLLCDAMGYPTEVDIAGYGSAHVHEGMWRAAERIKAELLKGGVLEGIYLQFPEVRGMSFVITGHSLGAGVATLLALQLMEHETFKGE
jgi:sn1-specific diacylglycerol lipase